MELKMNNFRISDLSELGLPLLLARPVEFNLAPVVAERTIQADVELPPRSFDVITMWDVIDHILDPDPLFQRCHTLLRDGGMFFLRTPNVTVQLLRARINKLARGMRPNVNYLQAHEHAHHYSMSSIRKLLERNEFTRIQFVHL
jgi:2-polyprenyl-3-methyl-5-hydroxy-6-metoxy-1,4-benzoquinol methylase